MFKCFDITEDFWILKEFLRDHILKLTSNKKNKKKVKGYRVTQETPQVGRAS